MLRKTILYHSWDKLLDHSSFGTLYRLGLFIFLYFIGRYILLLFEGTILFNYFHIPFLWSIDQVSSGFLGLFYSDLTSSSDYIVSINNIEIIHLLPGCSGLHPFLRMTLILLLYPLSWKIKSLLFPLSWLIILFAASIHFILLVPINYHYPEYYSFSHNWFTKIIFYGFYFLIWLIWERIGYPKKKMIRDTQSAKRDK